MLDHSFLINIRGKLVDFSIPKIMGILNITPDSFSDGGKFNNEKSALLQVEKMMVKGADIIDIGAQSTRPNAEKISAKVEIERLGRIISTLKKEFPETIISLDTFYAEVVKFGFQEGVDIVNDISAGQYDANMLKTVSEIGLPYILMHSNPEYETMHKKKIETDIILEINQFLSEKISHLYQLGIKDVIVDPGFGFGKTVEQQFQMINEMKHIGFEKYPILVGISRKSFIFKSLGKSPLEIGEETEKFHLQVLQKGAKILRVHDVEATKTTINLFLNN